MIEIDRSSGRYPGLLFFNKESKLKKYYPNIKFYNIEKIL